jgi:two-component system response regulator
VLPQSVLLIEDNCDDEYLALRTLRKAGIVAISVARDGREALEILLGAGQSLPGFVLLDLRLPVVDGLEVLAILRGHEQTRALRVLILSSSEDPRDRDACSRLGVVAFLGKPLDIVELQRALSTLAEGGVHARAADKRADC